MSDQTEEGGLPCSPDAESGASEGESEAVGVRSGAGEGESALELLTGTYKSKKILSSCLKGDRIGPDRNGEMNPRGREVVQTYWTRGERLRER
jgi:hypothetical protein